LPFFAYGGSRVGCVVNFGRWFHDAAGRVPLLAGAAGRAGNGFTASAVVGERSAGAMSSHQEGVGYIFTVPVERFDRNSATPLSMSAHGLA